MGSKALTFTYVLDTNSYFTFSFIGTKRSMSWGLVGVEDISDNMAGEDRSNWKRWQIGNARFGFFPRQSTIESY